MERFQNDDFLSQEMDNQEYNNNNENFNYNNIRNKSSFNNINNNQSQLKKKFQENERENKILNKQNSFLEKPIIPERAISNFYGNEFLTDATLKGENFELPFHRIILCAASDFLNKFFTLNPDITQKTVVNLPQIIKSSFSQGNKRDCLDKIFKYCYYNQDIKSIESDITQNNCFTILELAHCLQIKSLCLNLEKIIIKNFLRDDNMIKISEESNIFELEELRKECSNKIKNHLGNIPNKTKVLTELKFDTFKDIISSDELDVEQEKDVADLVIEYIKSRKNIPEENLEVPPSDQNNMENQENEENKNNDEQPQNQENQNNENANEENNNKEDPYNNWKKHLEELEKNSKKHKLTPEEEKMLVLCIRFSYLSHSDLIALTNEPIMENFKDLILQGISARLDTYEITNEKKTIINLKPRHYLRGQQTLNNNIKNKNIKNNNIEDENNLNENIFDNNKNLKSAKNIGKPSQLNKFNDQRNFASSQPIIHKSNNFNEDINNSNSDYFRGEVLDIDEINSRKKKMAAMAKSSPGPYPPQDPKISKNFYLSQRKISNYNPIFKYTYDFDENGALYYLGTRGKTTIYRNPHELNLVTAFASSLSKGQISDFVGRNLVNLRTENEENSFFGVDLGENRTLVPVAYSLRNRNSSTHVMLCWNLEASNDKINFEILDTRIFSNAENPQIHQRLERERNLLKEPGCTSTWGISKKVKEKYPDGFRYFLIKQIDKNSNGSYNLTNSGFELYGEGKGNGWIFN